MLASLHMLLHLIFTAIQGIIHLILWVELRISVIKQLPVYSPKEVEHHIWKLGLASKLGYYHYICCPQMCNK